MDFSMQIKASYDLMYNNLKDYPERIRHTISVKNKAFEITKNKNSIFLQKLEIACILHDVFKYTDFKLYKDLFNLNDYNYILLYPSLGHGYLASSYYLKNIGTDQDIANALKYHTSGRENMSYLEELVLLSDKIEDLRTQDSCIRVRNIYNSCGHEFAMYYLFYLNNELFKKEGKKLLEQSVLSEKYYYNKLLDIKISLVNKALEKINFSNYKKIDLYNNPIYEKNLFYLTSTNKSFTNIKYYLEEAFLNTTFNINFIQGIYSDWLVIDLYDIVINILTENLKETFFDNY